MSSSVLRSGWPLLLAAILVFVLLAGCTGAPSGPAPVTTPATPAVTQATTNPVATTTVTTTPVPQTTTAPATTMTTVPPTTVTTPAAPVTVTIQDFIFHPASVTVPAGTTVTWMNKDTATHSIVSDAGKFSSSNLLTGQSFSFTFTAPGSYPYHCGVHTAMHGAIVVT
ncbi:MAG TPA: cupredoxin domain-containing protein [Methanomicrobiales archaeon]|nr:cupredoxin domain-containing protein [Methanomicrobiales archaeon]